MQTRIHPDHGKGDFALAYCFEDGESRIPGAFRISSLELVKYQRDCVGAIRTRRRTYPPNIGNASGRAAIENFQLPGFQIRYVLARLVVNHQVDGNLVDIDLWD